MDYSVSIIHLFVFILSITVIICTALVHDTNVNYCCNKKVQIIFFLII